MKAKDWFLFVALTLIWGASFLWIRIAVRDITPLGLVAFRLMFGVLGLAGFAAARRPGLPRGVRIWWQLVILGLVSAALPWLLISWAEQFIDSALAAVLNSTVPLFTIVIAHFFLSDDRMRVERVLGLLVGFAGVVVLMTRGAGGGAIAASITAGESLLGQGAMLLSALLYGIGNVYARRCFRGVTPLFQAFYSMIAADVLVWGFVRASDVDFHLPAVPLTWLAIAWLGILGSGVAYLLFYTLLHRIGPTRTAMVTYSIPLVGVTLGVIFLEERLDWQLIAGSVLIVSGVWRVNRD